MGFDVVAAAGGSLTLTQLEAMLDPVYDRIASAGASMYRPGGYICQKHAARTTGAPPVTQLVYEPLRIDRPMSFDRIAVAVSATAVNATERVGLYASAAAGDYPGALIAGTESLLDTSAATGVVQATINVAVTAGLYWLAHVAQGNAATVYQGQSFPDTVTFASAGAVASSTVPGAFRDVAGIAGALPAVANPDVTAPSSARELVFLRAV